MAKFSPIAPIRLMDQLNEHNALGDYLLVLAHDVIDNQKDYLNAVYHAMGDEGFLIMDNSMVELGESVDMGMLIEATEALSADCLVLPDVMADAGGTIKATEKALRILEAAKFKRGMMKVVQGNTEREIRECADWMFNNVPGHYWAIPRIIANTQISRMPTIWYINHLYAESVHEKPKIHLLGMSTYLTDDVQSCHLPNVMGIDSANPLVLGQREIALNLANYAHLPRNDYWEHTQVTKTTLNNIAYMRELIQ